MRRDAPDFVKPVLREVAFRLGSGADVAKLQGEVLDLQHQWNTILRNTAPVNCDDQPAFPHVLFVTGFGLGTGFLTREPILMMALKRRGCRVSSLFCDISLPACEFNATGNHIPKAGNLSRGISKQAKLATCRRCASNIRSTFSKLSVELHPYHQFLTEADVELAQAAIEPVSFEEFRSFVYEGVQVGEEVFASILRVTFKGTVEDTPFNRALVRRYLLSGVLMSRASEAAFRSLRPDRILMPHGVYITHGTAAKVARKLGIPLVVYGGGVRKDTLILSPEETYHRTLVSEPNDVWEDVDLSTEQRERTWRYALSKQSGGADSINYHPTPIEDAQILHRVLEIDDSRPLISLFTNVIWDAQIFYDGSAFQNILDWMRFSIDELARNDEVWAVIRIHPAEVKGGLPTQQPFLPEIKKWYPELPKNFRVIPPESNLSSYTLAEQSRASIIYGTKMGLELAVRGIPVVVCGQTFSRGKGFTIDISSKTQYAELLQRIHTIDRLDQEEIERALRYAHYLYFRRMIDFPYFSVGDYKTLQGKSLDLVTLADLDAGEDPNLDAICSAITELSHPYV